MDLRLFYFDEAVCLNQPAGGMYKSAYKRSQIL